MRESYAVDRLLEVSEKRKILEEEWNSNEKKDYIQSSRSRFEPSNFRSKIIRDKGDSSLPQKYKDKERLKQLAKDTIHNE